MVVIKMSLHFYTRCLNFGVYYSLTNSYVGNYAAVPSMPQSTDD